MKKFITICVMLGLIVNLSSSSTHAAISYGTPSPSLSPIFGTLVDFDDQPTGTPVLAGDYAAFGVASIVELTGGTLARYAGSQSAPNYIGTGFGYEIWGPHTGGWDGIIQINLAKPASQIGIGIADSQGADFLSVYDAGGNLLETYLINPGINVYAVITRPTYDISRIEVNGDFFALDDLQFNAIPAPGAILLGTIGVGVVGWLRRRKTL